VDLVDHPEHPPGWAYEDEGVVVALGRGSASVAGAFAAVPELAAALSRPGAVFLDVGAGVAALSVAVCRQWPGVRVVGLEPWPFASVTRARRCAASRTGSSCASSAPRS
jgi:hypothetical protein